MVTSDKQISLMIVVNIHPMKTLLMIAAVTIVLAPSSLWPVVLTYSPQPPNLFI